METLPVGKKTLDTTYGQTIYWNFMSGHLLGFILCIKGARFATTINNAPPNWTGRLVDDAIK